MKASSFVYVAVEEDAVPIASSNDLNELFLAVDYHFGAHEKFKNESTRLSWLPYNPKYPSDYEGKLIYDCPTYDTDGTRITVAVKIYSVEHFNRETNDTGTTTTEVSQDF
jgi:hypothetical protein